MNCKIIFTIIICIFIISIITGCGSNSGTVLNPSVEQNNSEKMGTVVFNVRWPAEFIAQTVPPDAAQLQFRVSAIGMKTIKDYLDRPFVEIFDNPFDAKTMKVPVGKNRLFDVIAVDSKGIQVAVGTTLADVNPDVETRLIISLTPVSGKLPPVYIEYDFSLQAAPNPKDLSKVDLSISGIVGGGGKTTLLNLTEDNFIVLEDNKVRVPITVEDLAITNNKIDIVFLLDTTKSMVKEIEGVKNSVQSFVSSLGALDVQLAAVTFGDEIRNTYFFTSDVLDFKSFIGTLKADGGNDAPENDLEACYYAVNNFTYRKGAQRIFILITDSTLHYSGDGSGFTNLTIAKINAILSGNTVVHVVGPDVSSPSSRGVANNPDEIDGQSTENLVALSREDDPKSLAEGTGGTWTQMPSNGSVDLMQLPVAPVILNGYVITFPAGTIGTSHTIEVFLKYTKNDDKLRGSEVISTEY